MNLFDKSIESEDRDGHWHGYNEWYMQNELWTRIQFTHGIIHGYHEVHIGTIPTTYYSIV